MVRQDTYRMRSALTWGGAAIIGVLMLTSSAQAKTLRVDCDKNQTVSSALKKAHAGDTVAISGTCQETVTLTTDGVTLDGAGSAVLDGGATADVVVIDGAQRVTLRGLHIQNGQFSILGRGGASVALFNTSMQGNAKAGMRIEGSSSAELTDCVIRNNTLNGLEIDRGSEAKIIGSFVSENNGVFGVILNNASSATFAQATATMQHNVLGMQIGANSSVFVADAATTVTASNNLATGLTVVSGSTLFVFEGAIVAENNRFNHGVSANSRSNIDLDRGGSITTNNNGQDGVQLEDSLLNLFNMPGLPGSRVVASLNHRHGLSAFLESRIDLSADSVVTSQNNGDAGVLADNGSFVRVVNSEIASNNAGRDLVLSFGSRADLNSTNTIGSVSCDATVLIRGNAGFTCPAP
jgi:hypothetical protein